MQAENKVIDNEGNTINPQAGSQADPGPKDPKDNAFVAETEDADIVNPQSQGRVTNAGDELTGPSEARDEDEPTEEELDEKLNNARDALNDDSYALPPDERDDEVLN
jgi:hypothetical protein